jgi:hypothetical protein
MKEPCTTYSRRGVFTQPSDFYLFDPRPDRPLAEIHPLSKRAWHLLVRSQHHSVLGRLVPTATAELYTP